MKSAIFVDFDNIYTRLKEQDNALAASFATKPLQWVSWIEESLEEHKSNTTPRRILVRRCYLNPKMYGHFRPYFIRSAFETIDCPSLTTQGKNSADIHMILDIMDLIKHDTKFDEFIIMSADADFTPILLRLRKWDKRTTVLSIGPSALAYRAAADIVIDQDQFCEEALTDLVNNSSSLQREPQSEIKADLDECSKLVINTVGNSNAPVTMATIAAVIRKSFPQIAEDWGGQESFKKYLTTLNLSELSISNVSPGYIFDPKRHSPPVGSEPLNYEEEFYKNYKELQPLAKKISDLTDTPCFLPKHYSLIFNEIAKEVNAKGYHFIKTAKAVRDRCRENDVPVSRQNVNFILRSITFAGHHFNDNDTKDKIAKAFLKNTVVLCAKAQINLTEKEIRLMKDWLS